MELVSAIKETEILKYICFDINHVPTSREMGLFLRISMGTMIVFPGTSRITKNTNWVE